LLGQQERHEEGLQPLDVLKPGKEGGREGGGEEKEIWNCNGGKRGKGEGGRGGGGREGRKVRLPYQKAM